MTRRRIILAFDSFKGSLTATEACQAAARGIARCCPGADICCLPMSDGGEGMVDCIATAIGAQYVEAVVHDPLMLPVTARYAIAPDTATAYIEMAAASGLTLVPPERRDPTRTTTYGVGELLLDAVYRGCRHVVMGIGGSATCDAGQGMLDALHGHLPLPVDVTVACDVSNPLYGPDGAAHVFAPQKGATPRQVDALDQRLRGFARQAERAGVSPALAHHPGAGAAGGLGYGLMAYLGARLTSGIDLVMDAVGLDQYLLGADLVLTGEGASDRQTLMGKVPMGILRRARRHGVPVVLLAGHISDEAALRQAGFADVRCINQGDDRPLDVLMQPAVASHNLEAATARPQNPPNP